MDWYVIKLVYQIVNESNGSQFDEQLRLIRADAWDWAVQKAHTIGRLGEEMFFTDKIHQVRWKFVGVSDIISIGEIEDGAELFSETRELKNARPYLDVIKKRDERLHDISGKGEQIQN